MELLRDFGQFLWAVITNWAGYATGGILVALVGLWSITKRPPSKKFSLCLLGVFLFLAFFNAWEDEHKKAKEGAYLQGMAGFYFQPPTGPFPLNSPITFLVHWRNHGSTLAENGIPKAKVYLLGSDAVASKQMLKLQEDMISDWKKYYEGVCKLTETRETAPLFVGDVSSVPAEGPILTEEERDNIFTKKTKYMFVIGAVRFSDSHGWHEAHYCSHLSSLNVMANVAGFEDCEDYVKQIDISEPSK